MPQDVPNNNNNKLLFIVVILAAIAGFVLTFEALNLNYVQYKPLGSQLCVQLERDSCVPFQVTPVFTLPARVARPAGAAVFNDKGFYLFHYNPVFLLWTMLILTMMTIAFGSCPVFIATAREIMERFLKKKNKLVYNTIGFTVSIALIMMVLPVSLKGYFTPYHIIDQLGILLRHAIVIPCISVCTVLLCIPMLVVMFMVGIAAHELPVTFTNDLAIKKAANDFKYLNATLHTALQVLAIIVVLSGLCSSALAQSLKSVFLLKEIDIFPKEVNYAYGMFYALFLAVCYIPVYYTLQQKGKSLKDAVLSIEMPDPEVKKSRKELSSYFDIKVATFDNLKMAFTILSPFLASFLPEGLMK